MDTLTTENFSRDSIIKAKLSTIKEFESKFILHTEGSHSVRYNSICFIDDDSIAYPCGIYLNKFSIKENKIEKTIFIDNSIIFNVQKKDNFLIAVCYNGKGALIDLKDFSIAKKFGFENANTVSNVSFSDDLTKLVISVEYYKDKETGKYLRGACGILIFNEMKSQYDLIHVFKKYDCLAELNSENNLVIIEKVFAEEIENDYEEEENSTLSKDFYYKSSLFNLNSYLDNFKNYVSNNSEEKEDSMEKPDIRNYLMMEKLLYKNEEVSFILKSEKRKLIGISFYKRNLLFVDLKSLESILTVEFEGKGFLGGMDFCDNKLYLTNKGRTIISLDLETFLANGIKNQRLEMELDSKMAENHDNLKIDLNNQLNLNGKKVDNQIKDYLLNELIIDNYYVHSLNYCLRVSPDGRKVCWVNESGLHVFSDNSSFEAVCITRNSPIKMTGVGLSISKNADYFAVGDLEGNINIYKIYDKYQDSSNSSSGIIKNVSTLKTFDSIRCLEWSEVETLYIGCMSGKLFQARKIQPVNENLSQEDPENFQINLLDNFHSTITCIRIYSLILDVPKEDKIFHTSEFEEIQNTNTIKNFIFLSTTRGEIIILYNCKHGFIRLKKFLAHPPQPENRDLRFGSLNLKAEVWSIAIKEKYKNEQENKLILNIFSASEDQMVKIWEMNLFDLIHFKDIVSGICIGTQVKFEENCIKETLSINEIKSYKNHALAVTSVDCKEVTIENKQKRILATCSDDKIINIYDAEDEGEFTFIASLTTKNHVVGWHTITYLSLEENGHRLAVVTQNGFLVIFNLLDFRILFCEKIHLGGIEGLSWKKNTIITCSSDLNLGIINLQ